MNISKQKDLMVIAIAVLWLACIIIGTVGNHVVAMVLGVFLMLLHMMLGTAKNGVLSKKFFLYPLLIWTVLWISSFLLSGYFSNLFGNAMPSFTFLGLHPSFAPTIFLYWIGGQLTLNLGHYLYQDEWLSEKDWEDFCNRVKTMEEVK